MMAEYKQEVAKWGDTISITVTEGNKVRVYCSQGNREQPAHYLKQYKKAGKRFRVYGAII